MSKLVKATREMNSTVRNSGRQGGGCGAQWAAQRKPD